MLHDLKHAYRMLMQSKGWTLVVLLSLAIGIGATTALFTAVNGLLLQTVAVRDPGERTLVELTRQALSDAGVDGTWKAEAAYAVARLIDNERHGASGAASNIKCHREAVQFALADSTAELDAIDVIFMDDRR